MHYDANSFSRNGQPTIVPIQNASAYIGQRIALSPIDILEVQRFYGCVPTPSTTTTTAASTTGTTSSASTTLASGTTDRSNAHRFATPFLTISISFVLFIFHF